MSQRRTVVFVMLSSLLIACASSPTRDGVARLSSPSPNLITADELRATGLTDLYDAIAKARPAFFATRGTTSILNEPTAFVVIMNRAVNGGLDQLRGLDARVVRSVRRLSASDVYQITGKAASSGGVEVVMGP
jgi:hypothetical protein